MLCSIIVDYLRSKARGAALLSLMAALWLTPSAQAKTSCQDTLNGPLCISEVDFQRFAQTAFQTQLASQWCWAASISMIFSYHSHPVAQSRIVSEVYGLPVNMPAQAGIQMSAQLNKEWTDDSGRRFSSKVTGLYDAYAGVYGLTNDQIIRELDQDRPLLYANTHHAVVLTAIQYYRTPLGPNVVSAGVFDPWPGEGARKLTPTELMPAHMGGELTFVATANVTEVATPPPSSSQSPTSGANQSSDGGGGALDRIAISAMFSSLLLALLRRRSKARSTALGVYCLMNRL